MRLLLDTHVALWAVARTGRLPPAIQTLIGDVGNDVFVSAASLWEISIKRSLPRRRLGDISMSSAQAMTLFLQAGYGLLAISSDHAIAVEGLPPLHDDPFDRILVAQALCEPMRLVTHDNQVAAYSPSFVHF